MKNPIFKKYMNLVIIIGLILGFVIFAGCTDKPKITNQTPNVSVITQPSTIPTTYHYVKSIREIPGNDTNVTVQKTVQVTQTPVVKATLENVDIESMEFVRYDNGIVEVMYPRGWNVTEINYNRYYSKDFFTNSTTWTEKFKKYAIFSSPFKGVNYTVTIWEIKANSWRVNWDDSEIYEYYRQYHYPEYDIRSISNIDRSMCDVDGTRTCFKLNVHAPNETLLIWHTVTLHYSYDFELSAPNTSVFNHYKNVGDYMTGMVKIKDIRTT